MLGMLVKLFGGNILGGVGSIIKTVFGDKAEREEFRHREQISVQENYSAEFQAPEKQHWFNMLVDGANRLVRPFFTFGIVALFVWCVVDPVAFSVAMKALALAPDHLWWIMLTVVTFWFGGRLLENLPAKYATPSLSVVRDIIQAQKEANALNEPPVEKSPPISNEEYERQMRNENRPLTNSAILEWNKRNNKK